MINCFIARRIKEKFPINRKMHKAKRYYNVSCIYCLILSALHGSRMWKRRPVENFKLIEKVMVKLLKIGPRPFLDQRMMILIS